MAFKTLLANLNLANQLTFLRLAAVPFLVLLVLQGRFGGALAVFVAAAMTDLLDGLTARVLGQVTPLGAYLDPVADKLLLTTVFVLFTEYPSMFQTLPMTARIPIWLTVLTISRDVIILGVSLILYLAKAQTRFVPTLWGKLTTVSESFTAGAFLLANFLGSGSPALDVLVFVTLGLTLISGFHYMTRTIRMQASGGRDDEIDDRPPAEKP